MFMCLAGTKADSPHFQACVHRVWREIWRLQCHSSAQTPTPLPWCYTLLHSHCTSLGSPPPWAPARDIEGWQDAFHLPTCSPGEEALCDAMWCDVECVDLTHDVTRKHRCLSKLCPWSWRRNCVTEGEHCCSQVYFPFHTEHLEGTSPIFP